MGGGYHTAVRVAFDVGPVRHQPTGVGLFASSMATALASELGTSSLTLIGRRDGATGLPDAIASTPLTAGGYVGWLQTMASKDTKRTRADIAHFSQGMVPFIRATPTVLSVHDMSLVRLWKTHPFRRLSQIPLVLLSPRLADLVLVPSRATADEVIGLTGLSAAKIDVVPYAAQHGIAPPDLGTAKATLVRHRLTPRSYILALGTIEPRKNQARLVEAFEQAVRTHQIPPDTELVFVGGLGWRAGPIIRRIRSSDVAHRIRRLGYVPQSELWPLMSQAAAVAYVSLYEGFGLPVVEAMACGAPTVTSNVSSMPEVAGDAGFLVDPLDAREIARGLSEAVSAGSVDPVGVASRAVAQASKFSWHHTARAFVEVYEGLLR